MRKKYTIKNLMFILFACAIAITASCKKDKSPTSQNATPKNIGLIEASDSTYIRDIYILVNKIGTQTVSEDYDYLYFDTGSGGMVYDAHGIIPSTMITNSGFVFTGDSTVVNGITITNQTSTIQYGDDANNTLTVYGNLAYAPVTIDQGNGNLTITRLPFFLTYLAKDNNGTIYTPHTFDVFGVNPEYDLLFSNGIPLRSPFSFYSPGTGLTKGFKMAALGTTNFSADGTYVNNAVTLGLTSSDLSTSSGFSVADSKYDPEYGYDPYFPGTITYNGKTISTDILFDTGTNYDSEIEDPTATSNTLDLPVNSTVAIATNSGFKYSYTVSSTYFQTYVIKSSAKDNYPSVFGIDFFLNNEYMLDYTDHTIGVKNN